MHPKIQIFLAGVFSVLGLQMSARQETFNGFQAWFLTSFGIGQGMVYSLVLYHSWLFFPGKEGIVSGIIIGGFGIGGFIFIPLSSSLINPDGVESKKVDPSAGILKPYPIEIGNNLPHALNQISFVWIIIFLFAMILTWSKTLIRETGGFRESKTSMLRFASMVHDSENARETEPTMGEVDFPRPSFMDKSIDKSADKIDFGNGLVVQNLTKESPAFDKRPDRIVNSFSQGVREEKNIFKYIV